MEQRKYLKWYHKVGYGTGDVAGNCVYALLTAFMMIYLTDTVGLSMGIVSTLIAVSKIFDGVSDFFFGRMIDKTHTKMGKARPWMLWPYIGCSVCLVACFAIPTSWGETAQYAFFFIAYTLLNAVFFTANNIAYASLTALITKNTSERVQLGSFRFVFAFATKIIIEAVTVQVLHDHHAGGVQLQTCLEILGVEVIGSLGGHIEQGLVADGALGTDMDPGQGLLVVVELLPVEGIVLLLGHVLLGTLPQGHHGVEGVELGVILVLILGALLDSGLGDLHADGVADVVGILADKGAELVLLQELGVVLLLGICLDGHDDVGTGGITLSGLDGVAVGVRGPLPGGVCAVLLGDDGDGVGHHKGGVEAHAELTDDVDVLVLLHGLLEDQAAGLGDGTQVLLHVGAVHADAVVGNGQRPLLLIGGNGDLKIAPVEADVVVGQGGVGQLVDGVGGVGDDLPEEDFLVGVDGVDHHIHQTLAFSLELHFFHSACSLPFVVLALV